MASWQTSNINSIFVGTNPNDGTGNDLRTSFTKVDTNFANITAFLTGTGIDFPSANVTAANVVVAGALYSPAIFNTGNITASGINTTGASNLSNTWATQLVTTGKLYANSGIVTTGSITPSANVSYDLGSPNNFFRNLYVQGTVQVNTVQSSSNAGLLGINANVQPGDVKDVGISGKYNQNSSNSYAFFGFQHTTNNFVYKQTLTDATQSTGIVSDGVYGNVQFGSLFLSNTTASASSTSGVLLVAGGAGIAGNLYIGGNVTSGNSASTTYYGNVVASLANIGRATMANIAGNVWVDGTITAAGSPVVTFATINGLVGVYNGGVFAGPASYLAGTPSTSTSTGALVVPNGGLGVTGNVTAGALVGPYYGLVQTPNQTNITGLGTLGALNVTGTGTFNTVQATSVGATTLTVTGTVHASTIVPSGGLSVTGDVNPSGNINVGGNLNFTGNTGAPSNKVTPAGWMPIMVGSTTYYLPMYR